MTRPYVDLIRHNNDNRCPGAHNIRCDAYRYPGGCRTRQERNACPKDNYFEYNQETGKRIFAEIVHLKCPNCGHMLS